MTTTLAGLACGVGGATGSGDAARGDPDGGDATGEEPNGGDATEGNPNGGDVVNTGSDDFDDCDGDEACPAQKPKPAAERMRSKTINIQPVEHLLHEELVEPGPPDSVFEGSMLWVADSSTTGS